MNKLEKNGVKKVQKPKAHNNFNLNDLILSNNKEKI